MYSYVVQQEDIDILRQNVKITYAKIELLNSRMQIVDTIEGQIYNDNFSLDGDSAIRRTYTCDIVVSDDMFLIGKDKNIWADRFIRIYYGIEHSRSKEILWYKLGTFSFVDVGYSFSSNEKKLSLTCNDMMALYNGVKRGVIIYNTKDGEVTFKIEAGTSFREAITTMCTDAGIVDYVIKDIDGYYVPYDLEFSAGTTYYDVWSKLNSLYGYWEFFFDEDGKFIWQEIPSGFGDEIILDDGILKPLVINESISDTFQNIYNVTEVWGKVFDLQDKDRYVSTPNAYSTAPDGGGVFNVTLFDGVGMPVTGATTFTKDANYPGEGHYMKIENISEAEQVTVNVTYTGVSSETITLQPKQSVNRTITAAMQSVVLSDPDLSGNARAVMSVGWQKDQTGKLLDFDNFTYLAIKVNGTSAKYININGLQNIPILDVAGNDYADDIVYNKDTVYVFCYRRVANGFTLNEQDPTFPNFYLLGQYQAHGYYEETNDEVPYSINNLGYKAVNVIEKQDLYTDEDCFNQAVYETYKTTAKQDSISLTTMIIPFLEPNQKIRYSPFMTNELGEWLIKKMSWSTMSGTMSMEIFRFLEKYEYVYNKRKLMILDEGKLNLRRLG